ncbi:MAG TPA: hypothetical protein DDZ80_23650 [Cyanobacteria bacterium UBA8803]|nr:hypothetical protein [Cyanobacteria bacterium UBA9273]HBL61316.1 hypothetical protein [Cyanobacteria bacterium UBA8803]
MMIPESVTFEEAIALTESMMAQMATDEISPAEAAEAISQLVKTENGARGFFVTYLSSEATLADHPSPETIQALQSSPDIVAELLVKNLAMSAAMAVTHRRNGDEDMAQGSDRVRSRTANLIEQLQLDQVRDRTLALRESALTGEGNYKTFLQRWQYDAQQREVICQTIDEVMGNG